MIGVDVENAQHRLGGIFQLISPQQLLGVVDVAVEAPRLAVFLELPELGPKRSEGLGPEVEARPG